jgi:alkanesulfonate monooxygenase SsuD/methylene tetrahydromethanopterin reductase-like flavin-dependent oxidoreductase (luciferase family)
VQVLGQANLVFRRAELEHAFDAVQDARKQDPLGQRGTVKLTLPQVDDTWRTYRPIAPERHWYGVGSPKGVADLIGKRGCFIEWHHTGRGRRL